MQAEKAALSGQGPFGPWVGDGSGKWNSSVISDMEEPPSEPAGSQDEVEESQQEPACGLDMGECERRAREMLGVGAV